MKSGTPQRTWWLKLGRQNAGIGLSRCWRQPTKLTAPIWATLATLRERNACVRLYSVSYFKPLYYQRYPNDKGYAKIPSSPTVRYSLPYATAPYTWGTAWIRISAEPSNKQSLNDDDSPSEEIDFPLFHFITSSIRSCKSFLSTPASFASIRERSKKNHMMSDGFFPANCFFTFVIFPNVPVNYPPLKSVGL